MVWQMRIDLAGWSSNGLRSPDVEVNLTDSDGEPAQVALVQMPNGTGKTTTLELIKATLSNTAVNWSQEQVRSYRRRRDSRPEGQFKVRILVNGRPLTFELTLDFENGTTRYRTTNLGSGGIALGWTPPPDVHRFLSSQFLRLFIFDGEFADELFNAERSEADRAIDALCQLYLLDEVKAFAEEEWERRSKSGMPKTNVGLERYQKEHAKLEQRGAELRQMQSKAEKKIQELDDEVSKLEGRISDHLSKTKSTQENFIRASQSLSDAEASVSSATGAAMGSFRMPIAIHSEFARQLVLLKENLDRLRLPENTSTQFFEELVEEVECICGRPMTEGAKTEIAARANRYLDADDAGTINALKADIDKFTANDGDEPDHLRLSAQLSALGDACRAERHAKQLVRTLKQTLIDQGDEQLKTWEAELREKSEKYNELSTILSDICSDGDPDDDPIWSLKQLEKKKSEVSAKIAEITSTVVLRKQTDLLKKILAKATKIARTRIKAELVADANRRLKDILINDPLEIAQIDKSLRLADQEGASVGQTLSVGYTFLMSVLNRGNNNFPLVVDSPANPIDDDVRKNIGALIPQLCTQFVGFTINTERPGFVSALEAAAGEVSYFTMFRKTEGTQRLMGNLPSEGVTETETAVLIKGRDYFMRFGLQSEEEV